ncbi:MAG: DNA replication and repair protein RecF [Termitinemataceae bacterium]|nr:MAG: DNA replication and repair protein RecF [Termitinemataceae bacterium]
MVLSSLSTCNFRNLKDDETDLKAKNVYLVGINGQGKTNFLEALYFSNYASSFRGVKDSDIISLNKKDFSVRLKLCNSIIENILIKIENNKKTILIDNKKIDSRKDLLSIMSCIIFCHEDMEFITGSPEKRRWFFDQNISLYNSEYLEDLQRYKKVLKSRNIILKEIKQGSSSDTLNILDPQLAEYGLRIINQRIKETEYFSEIFNRIYNKVAEIYNINITYKKSWTSDSVEEITSYLLANRERDVFFGSTLSGPHRDKYCFNKNKSEFSENASTGQKRLFALLLRVAQASRYTKMTGKNPILLLDDVLLELDGEKRIKFLNNLPEYEQAFFTFLPEEPYQKYKDDKTKIYYVNDGILSE